MRVLKFGGTSVGTVERINAVLDQISTENDTIVVLSAMSGTTNSLQELADALYVKDTDVFSTKLSELKKKYDEVVLALFESETFRAEGQERIDDTFRRILNYTFGFFSTAEENEILHYGEILSTHLVALRAQELGINATWLDALSFMKLDVNLEPDVDAIRRSLELTLDRGSSNVWITQGYICRDHTGKISNLQRGGSDYTAALIGEAVNASEVQIWTDIDGMHNNDPRIVENTAAIREMSYNEAAELAYFGAKVLHPQCVFPVQRASIPMSIKYSMEPDAPGTTISESSSGQGIKALAAKDNITAIKIKSSRMLMSYGFLRKVFEVFETHRTPIDMITTSEVALSITIDDDTYLTQIVEDLEKLGELEVDQNQTIVCIVGDFIADSKGYAGRIFSALNEVPVRMVSYGGSKHNVSIVVNTSDKEAALQNLHLEMTREEVTC